MSDCTSLRDALAALLAVAVSYEWGTEAMCPCGAFEVDGHADDCDLVPALERARAALAAADPAPASSERAT